MGEPEKEKTEEFLEMVNGFPRDRGIRHMTAFHKRALEEEGLELSLGLSLNGKFGVEPKRAKTSALTCVSLVSCFMPGGGGGGGVGVESQARVFPDATSNPWTRTGSLPSETQEELRKRKELQSLRRLEAKKRRMEKLKFPRCGRDKIDSAENSSEENGSNIDSIGQDSGCNYANYNSNWMPSSQVSIGSQGSGSSVLSEFDSQPTQGSNFFPFFLLFLLTFFLSVPSIFLFGISPNFVVASVFSTRFGQNLLYDSLCMKLRNIPCFDWVPSFSLLRKKLPLLTIRVTIYV